MSTDESVSNLSTKYNRLISDYKNLREKHNLLKNALISERDKSKELESIYVENGIQSRKVLQELESLKFRNEMLSKQINTLRDELDHERQIKYSKKGAFKSKDGSSQNEDIVVIKEELINKIDECSSLHSQLLQLQLEYQMDTNNFRSAINDLENQLKLIKSQNSTADLNIRKALANEIEDRTALETKLENKDNIINKFENSEKKLLQEINELKQKLQNHTTSPAISNRYCKDLCNDYDNYSDRSKELKKSNSPTGSINSITNNDNLNTNEIYICSLIDKIGQLEQKVIALELDNQITSKRQQIEKQYRDLYESYIVKTGDHLPQLGGKTSKTDKFILSDNNTRITEFYESKFMILNKQMYQATAKAALYFDEAKILATRLEIERGENASLRDDIELMKDKIISCQEDLELTGRQYENKMREMSIHIAELNTQINRRGSNQKNQPYGDIVGTSNENVSSIKYFINSLKK